MIKKGIYKITNLQTGKVYVGLSNNINRRWIKHRSELKNNCHINSHLQKSYNKYGKENFKYEILELCSEEELVEFEKKWIKKEDSYNNGYNLTKGGINIGYGENHYNFNNKKYTFYHFDGRIEKNINCYEMIKKHFNDKPHSIHSLVRGLSSISGGWVINKELLTKNTHSSRIKFYNKDGRETDYITQNEFCKLYNLNLSSINLLALKKQKQHNGWFICKKEMQNFIDKRCRNLINVNTGEVLLNATTTEFRNVTGASKTTALRFFNGGSKESFGWKINKI